MIDSRILVFFVLRFHIADEEMVHFSVALFEMADAERDLEEMQSMIERLRMQIQKEGGYGSSVQMDRIHACLRLFKFALDRERVTFADDGRGRGETTSAQAVAAWLEGETAVLEGYLRGKSWEEVEDVEDDAVLLLHQRYPEWAWKPHQRALAARVGHRMQRKRLYVEMIMMPPSVGRRFLEFGAFRKGDPDIRGFTHEFSARENVTVLGEESEHRKEGYVADESEMTVVLIDLMGNSFRKNKRNVEAKVNSSRLRIIDREVAELTGQE